jgi:hypothetical protein
MNRNSDGSLKREQYFQVHSHFFANGTNTIEKPKANDTILTMSAEYTVELVLTIKTTVPGHPRRTHSPRYQLVKGVRLPC